MYIRYRPEKSPRRYPPRNQDIPPTEEENHSPSYLWRGNLSVLEGPCGKSKQKLKQVFGDLPIYIYIYIYIYTQHGWAFGNLAGNFTDWDSLTYWYLIYIVYKYLEPKWPLSLKVNTPKTRPFAIKTRVIWVLGIYTYIYITFTYSLHAVPTFCDKTLLFKARFEEIFERWHQKKVCNAKANNLSKKNDKMLPRTARI